VARRILDELGRPARLGHLGAPMSIVIAMNMPDLRCECGLTRTFPIATCGTPPIGMESFCIDCARTWNLIRVDGDSWTWSDFVPPQPEQARERQWIPPTDEERAMLTETAASWAVNEAYTVWYVEESGLLGHGARGLIAESLAMDGMDSP
jgi:hypothetical protein